MKLNYCRYLGGHSSAQQNEIAPVIQWAVKPNARELHDPSDKKC